MINVEFIYNNLDKLFAINFTMLAFIITAITILQTIHTIKRYNTSIFWNFVSGIVICLLWFIRADIIELNIKIAICIISFLLFGIAIFKTYQAYNFLIYFIKKQ